MINFFSIFSNFDLFTTKPSFFKAFYNLNTFPVRLRIDSTQLRLLGQSSYGQILKKSFIFERVEGWNHEVSGK